MEPVREEDEGTAESAYADGEEAGENNEEHREEENDHGAMIRTQ